MGIVNCYDVVEMVTEEATTQFGVLLKVDEAKLHKLKSCCEMIDDLSKKFNGISYEVEVNDDTTDITISLVCGEFAIDKTTSSFYNLIKMVKKINFKPYEEEQIQIDFTFGGIWVRSF